MGDAVSRSSPRLVMGSLMVCDVHGAGPVFQENPTFFRRLLLESPAFFERVGFSVDGTLFARVLNSFICILSFFRGDHFCSVN